MWNDNGFRYAGNSVIFYSLGTCKICVCGAQLSFMLTILFNFVLGNKFNNLLGN